jgi:hypothetical protein
MWLGFVALVSCIGTLLLFCIGTEEHRHGTPFLTCLLGGLLTNFVVFFFFFEKLIYTSVSQVLSTLDLDFSGILIYFTIFVFSILQYQGSSWIVDGMPALFYRQYLDTIELNVIREVKIFMNDGVMYEKWNEIVSILISKEHQKNKIFTPYWSMQCDVQNCLQGIV